MENKTLVRIFVLTAMVGSIGCGQSPNPSGTAVAPAGNSASTETQKPAESLFAPKPIVIEAGTTITVTADQSINSKTSNPGDRFEASLAAPVMVGEKQAIPMGAKAVGIVASSKSAGKFKGNAEISVRLDSVTVNGEKYSVKTSSVTEAGKGRGKRTAVGAGGGAAVGALIGAIAGHGKGAAIGAVAGGGAGTAGAAYTGDRDITIGAETKLKFKLKEPLEIKGQ